MIESSTLIRPFRIAVFRQALFWALTLSLLFVVMRVAGTMGGRVWQPLLPIGFVLMTLMPWILLTREGRARIGMIATTTPRHWYVFGALLGVLAASLCHVLGVVLFGYGQDHWFVTVANTYRNTMNTTRIDVVHLYLIFTIPAMLFSPVGEEIFFRGFLQQALQEKFTQRVSTMIEAALFGSVHLCHHGLFLTVAGLSLHPMSGAIWVGLMFCTALMFAWLRQRSGSLYPAMISHAAFNVTMNAWIFTVLWK